MFEIEHIETPDGTECGHVSTGRDEDQADLAHLLHCLHDHDLEPEIEAEIVRRLRENHGYDPDL